MKREVSYQWRLREVMAASGMFTVTELVPLLRDRGIDLSASQVHRLASGTPERLSLAVLAALCDILSCTPAELIATRAQDAPLRTHTSALVTLFTASTIMPALLYASTVLLYVFLGRRRRGDEGHFSLGRWEIPVIAGALIWLAYELIILIGPAELLRG